MLPLKPPNVKQPRLLEALARFVKDVPGIRRVTLLRLTPDEVVSLAARTEELGLDFDDAYQYVAAVKRDLTLQSFSKAG